MARHTNSARSIARNFLDAVGIRGGARIKEIHPPPNPNPKTLKGEDADFWRAVHDNAYGYYSTSGAPEPDKVAANSAWKALRGRKGQQNVWRQRNPEVVKMTVPRTAVLSVKDPVVTIGPLLEYVWIDQTSGDIAVVKWSKDNPPSLYWDKSTKSLISYPHAPDPDICYPLDMSDEAIRSAVEEYEMFTQRRPECENKIPIPKGKVHPVGLADSVVYVSDKWNSKNPDIYKRGSQEYFHQNSDGTWVFQDTKKDPSMIRFHGGMLDVESRGIIH